MDDAIVQDHEPKHSNLTEKVIGVFYEVYNELGHGFLECVYENAMCIAVAQIGLSVIQQADVRVAFRGRVVGEFRADLIVEGCVLVELKAARTLDAAHEAQVLNYLRATELEVGLLLNFGPKPQIKRLIFDNERKKRATNDHG